MSTEQQSGEWSQQFPPPAAGVPVPPPPHGDGGRAIAVVALVVGLVAGAGLASGAWLLFGDSGGAIGGSSVSVSAPARLGDYYRFSDLPKVRTSQSDDLKEMVDRQARWDQEGSTRLSASRDGAGAVVQRYASEDLESMFSLEVVRSPSPSPQYVPYTDAEYLGLDKPLDEMLEFGSVSCVVRNDPSGQTFVTGCQRTSGNLTVTVAQVNGDLNEKPETVAKLVDEAWTQLA